MSKKDELLGKKDDAKIEYFELNQQEKNQLGSILELMNQARTAQDILYSTLVEAVASRYEISGASLDINWDVVQKSGINYAKLIVKKS